MQPIRRLPSPRSGSTLPTTPWRGRCAVRLHRDRGECSRSTGRSSARSAARWRSGSRRDYQPEIVLGVAKAGVIPGVVVASILQSEFTLDDRHPQAEGAAPVLVSGPPPTIRGRRVLVVDETCDTGSTMQLALSEVRALHPAEVRTAVSFKTGEYAPDYHAFETENFIVLPWDREIVQNGELVVRPEYAARL